MKQVVNIKLFQLFEERAPLLAAHIIWTEFLNEDL